jgi:hypothetical protein
MCYVTFLSTSSAEDLSARSTEFVRFEKDCFDEPAASVMLNEHKWYVGSGNGCSCAFRHLMSPELGFGHPVEWYREDGDAINATAHFEAVVRDLLARGHSVDCVDAWNGTEAGKIVQRSVDLSALEPGQFRFFENYHFVFAR